MSAFGDRLRELRKSRGLSQNSLSGCVGVSKSSINMYERGEREPGFETMEAIADYFNVDMDYLLGRSSQSTKINFRELEKGKEVLGEDYLLVKKYIELPLESIMCSLLPPNQEKNEAIKELLKHFTPVETKRLAAILHL